LTLAAQRKALPDQPGVYLFRDSSGRVVYVGKAKSIRKRVASHFARANVPSSPGHAEMVASATSVECVVVATEAEALLTE
jgi:excinuclease ABC subunit C